MNQCTGLSAGWCPIHGDCICKDENGEMPAERLNNPDCPLHSDQSEHGKIKGISTIWGMVAFADISGSELNDGAWR
jgi:hypothetical protein